MTTTPNPRRDVAALERALTAARTRTAAVEAPLVPVDTDPDELARLLEGAATALSLADREAPAPLTTASLMSAAAAFIRDRLAHPAAGALADAAATIPAARASDPATSRNAAPRPPRRGTQAAHLLWEFYLQWNRVGGAEGGHREWTGLTSEEAAFRSPRVRLSSEYAKRCSDLHALGLIEPTEWTRAGESGRDRTVYRITEAGRALAAELGREGSA